ncbi:2-hydroxy-3-oxopropionate reductase [uncultured delta proteobacterium]|uniref:2-hydroxy-3-oxopropionate reductase n=1 Tax=uncultured delta proteobacterium TaxID=34034 RepID=A0A212K9S7_9DELT|nr:2-hydroxy-3-oxopropionate reductase [uncultured delta proteobacterium]
MGAITRIGFIGLGQMGSHMARNLLRPDTALVVSDLSAERVEALCASGARAATGSKDFADCSLIFISVPGGKELKSVVLEEGGLMPHLSKGQTVVDLSTVVLSATREVAGALAAKGVDFLDAPVSGMEKGAQAGTLAIMVGGEEPVFERVKPYLERIGKTIVHMGGHGAGQLTKAINNSLYDICIAGTMEILLLAQKAGLDPVKVGNVINNGSARSFASEHFIPRVLDGEFRGSFPIAWAYKDLITTHEVAIEKAVPIPILSAVTGVYRTAMQMGHGMEDKGSMALVYEDILNLKFRRLPE